MSKDKGLSEIIATVLMIMIVTVLGFSIFLYGLGFFTATTSANNQATATGIQSLQERFVIIDVNFTVTTTPVNNTIVTAWVYNYGSTNEKIVAMYLNGTQVSNVLSTLIDPNAALMVVGNVPFNVTQGIPQTIRVVSSLGNFYENNYGY
ncbi:MAG: archaellin/type IV pilin N-terminal domain-containing protein [Candidatus Methanomethylicaceae archaeon]